MNKTQQAWNALMKEAETNHLPKCPECSTTMKAASQGFKCPACGHTDALAKSDIAIPSYKLRLAANRPGATDTRSVWVEKSQVGSVEQFARKWRVLDATGTAIATGEVSLEAAVGKLLKHVSQPATEAAWPVAKSANALNQNLNNQTTTTELVQVAQANADFQQAVNAYIKLFDDGVIKGRANAAKHLAKCADTVAELTGINPLTKSGNSAGASLGHQRRGHNTTGLLTAAFLRQWQMNSPKPSVVSGEDIRDSNQGRMMSTGKELTDVSHLAYQIMHEAQPTEPIPANQDLPQVSWDSLVNTDEVMSKTFTAPKPEWDTWGKVEKHPGDHDQKIHNPHKGSSAAAAEADDDAELGRKKVTRQPPFKAVPPKGKIGDAKAGEAADDAELSHRVDAELSNFARDLKGKTPEERKQYIFDALDRANQEDQAAGRGKPVFALPKPVDPVAFQAKRKEVLAAYSTALREYNKVAVGDDTPAQRAAREKLKQARMNMEDVVGLYPDTDFS